MLDTDTDDLNKINENNCRTINIRHMAAEVLNTMSSGIYSTSSPNEVHVYTWRFPGKFELFVWVTFLKIHLLINRDCFTCYIITRKTLQNFVINLWRLFRICYRTILKTWYFETTLRLQTWAEYIERRLFLPSPSDVSPTL